MSKDIWYDEVQKELQKNWPENQEVQFKADGVLKQIALLKDNALWNRWSVNEAIASLIWGEPIIMGPSGGIKTLHWDCQNGIYLTIPPDFIGSLDAAITLFHPKPYQINSNPRIVLKLYVIDLVDLGQLLDNN